MSKHSVEKEKSENLLFKLIPRPRFTLSRAYESCLACQRFQKVWLFPNPVGSSPRTSFLLLHFSKTQELWSLKAAFTIAFFAAVNYDHTQRTLKKKHQTDRNPPITSHDLGYFPFCRKFRKNIHFSSLFAAARNVPSGEERGEMDVSQATEISVHQ